MKYLKKAFEKNQQQSNELALTVQGIVDDVRSNGDQALLELGKKFDGVELNSVKISRDAVKRAYTLVSEDTVKHFKFAADQVRYFAEQQLKCMQPLSIPDSKVKGLELGHRLVPVETCGCYIPSGRYPLPSTAIMSVLVAKVAGVKHVAACSPPSAEHDTIHPAVLVAMDIAGADEIYCMGGAQAIAAYAYGTETVKKVDMIVGPGNKYVTEAKRQVIGHVGIDMLAWPSEGLIVADETANPTFLAIDCLARCEHDPDARAIIVSTDEEICKKAESELYRLLEDLPTKEVAAVSWRDNGEIILADNMEEAIDIANQYAIEHLQVQVKNEREVAEKLLHYGSLFVGHYSPVAFGDFVSGTNHTLPTMATARFSSGLWVGTFIKVAFYQFVSKEGCKNLSEACMHFGETEGLYGHRDSVKLRIKE